MKFGSVGAVIAAASKKDAVPMLKIGSIPIVRRIVLTLQQAGVFPVVVVTGVGIPSFCAARLSRSFWRMTARTDCGAPFAGAPVKSGGFPCLMRACLWAYPA